MIRRLAVAIALVVLPVAVPANATPAFTAEIVNMSPALPTAGTSINVDLQLANPGAKDVSNLRVQFVVSTDPLIGRSQIDPIARGKLLPAYYVVPQFAASGIDLPSGASTTIPLSTNSKALSLRAARPGVYAFGVLVTADGAGAVKAITFLPWLPTTDSTTALGVVPVVTLSAEPQRSVDGTFLGAGLAADVSTGGRLRTQLDAMLPVRSATWLIDPATIEAVIALGVGARIMDGDAVRATSDDEMAAARAWIEDLRGVAARGQVYAIPAGDLDVRTALKFGHERLVRSAITRARDRLVAALQLTNAGSAVQLYDGSVSGSTWRLLRSLGVDVVFVTDRAYRATQQQYTPSTTMAVSAFAGGPVLVVDHVTSEVLTKRASESLLRQEFAAQLLMTYLEQPNKQRTVTVAVPAAGTPATLAQFAEVLNSRWISQVPVPIAAADSPGDRQVVTSTATRKQRKLNVRLERAIERQRLLEAMTDDPQFVAGVEQSVEGIASRWLTAGLVPDTYSAATNEQLAKYTAAVRVVTRGDIVFGSEQGVVPVTVANGLPVGVDVVLQAAGLPSVRVAPTPVTVVHLNAGKRVSVEVPTRVTGSGTAYLRLWLETPEGTAIGESVILDIRSAAYTRVASYVVAAAFVTLLLLVAVNTFRRLRMRRAGQV